MEEQYASFIEKKDNLKQENKKESKESKKTCCDKPFPTCSIKTGISHCRSCDKKFKEFTHTVYSCDSCNTHDVEIDQILNLMKDGKTNWTICKKCSKYVLYQRIHKLEFL